MTEDQVLALAGPPLGRETSNYAHWYFQNWTRMQAWEYGQWTVLFKRGEVVGVEATAVEYADEFSVKASQAEEVFDRPPVRVVTLNPHMNDDITSFWKLGDSTILGIGVSSNSRFKRRLVLLPPFKVEVPATMWRSWEATDPRGEYQRVSAGRRIDTSQFPLAVRRL